MLRRLRQLRKGGTEARNRRRQQYPLIFLIIRWSCIVWCVILNWRFVLMNSTSCTVIPYRHAFYKKLETRFFLYITLQYTVIYRCWTETFHPIIFFSAINNCNVSPCLNNGTCNHLQDGFRCDCAQGFIGIICRGDSVLISFQLWNIKERLTFRVFEPTDKTTTFDRPLLRTWCSH